MSPKRAATTLLVSSQLACTRFLTTHPTQVSQGGCQFCATSQPVFADRPESGRCLLAKCTTTRSEPNSRKLLTISSARSPSVSSVSNRSLALLLMIFCITHSAELHCSLSFKFGSFSSAEVTRCWQCYLDRNDMSKHVSLSMPPLQCSSPFHISTTS